MNNKTALGCFASYVLTREYARVDTFKPRSDPLDFQETIIIGIVPGASGAFLAPGGVVWLGRAAAGRVAARLPLSHRSDSQPGRFPGPHPPRFQPKAGERVRCQQQVPVQIHEIHGS